MYLHVPDQQVPFIRLVVTGATRHQVTTRLKRVKDTQVSVIQLTAMNLDSTVHTVPHIHRADHTVFFYHFLTTLSHTDESPQWVEQLSLQIEQETT